MNDYASGGGGVTIGGPSAMDSMGGGGGRPARARPAGRPCMPFGGLSGPPAPQADFPLRILVNSEMVGAIIGRQGNTIRQITQSTRARVDVHRKDNTGSLEKAITIYGNPENCDNACKKIVEVMLQEAENTNKGEVPLKILAHNNLIGRIIGKGGNVIKRVMEETETKITVSSVADINSFNLERTITIRGDLDGMSEAERMVVGKLRQSYENDLQALAPQSVMYPGLHPMAMMSTIGLGMPRQAGGGGAGLYGSGPGTYPPVYPASQPHQGGPGLPVCETVYMYVPSAAVGAIIGRKGSYIRNIIRFSGSSVKIGQQEEEPGFVPEQPRDSPPPVVLEEGANGEGGHHLQQQQQRLPLMEAVAERKVTIFGSAEAQWKAQFLIFDKMREEGYGNGIEDVRLPVEMCVPSSQVGRIIGKKGQNVRELQRSTGTIIKLPQPPEDGVQPEETVVHMIGAFYSVQSAQRRIRSLVLQAAPPGGRPPRPPSTPPEGAPESQPPPPEAEPPPPPLI